MTKTLGKPRYTYSPSEVIELRDDKHTPHNKRPGQVDSTLVVQVRATLAGDWVTFDCEESTTTDGGRTATRTIYFSLSREEFAQIVAHVNRKE